jgi:outer membrane protein OmpA-like peptidoglycan-associated protein
MRTVLVVRRALLAAALLALCAARLSAQSPYPGPMLLTATSWEGEISGITSGFGALGGLSLEGFPLRRLTGTVQVGYRWTNDGHTIVSVPGAAMALGWRFPALGCVSLTPLVGTGLDLPVGIYTVTPVVNLTFALRASFLLARRDYLTLTPSFSVPLSANYSPRLSLAVGTRHETPWLIPVPEQTCRLSAVPALFSPDNDGHDDAVLITLGSDSPRDVREWRLTIYGPGDGPWKVFSGVGRLPPTIVWDGSSDSGRPCDAGDEFTLSLEVTDILGRVSVANAQAKVSVDILVFKDGDRYRVKVPAIHFSPWSYTLDDAASAAFLEDNRAVLARIASLFTRFPDYDLLIEGYANAEYWANPDRFTAEQKDELLPLSHLRADTVKSALITLGIDENRIRTTGLGAERPVADFADRENNWRNRRVEFILLR